MELLKIYLYDIKRQNFQPATGQIERKSIKFLYFKFDAKKN